MLADNVFLRVSLLLSIFVYCYSSDAEEAGFSKTFPRDPEEDGAGEDQLTDTQLQEAHAAFDQNGDNKISHEEVLTFVEKHHREMMLKSTSMQQEFKEEDASDNGDVSLEEHLNATVGSLEQSDRSEAVGKAFEQMQADETERFTAADMNGDGMLNRTELASLIAPETNDGMLNVVVKHSFRKSDRDNNGRLSLDEFQEAEGAFLDSEQVTDEELAAKMSVTKSELETKSDDEMQELRDKLASQNVFTRLDKDGDGTLDEAELRVLKSGRIQREDMANRIVKALDTDGDGHVQADELLKGKKSVRDSELQNYLIMWAKSRQAIR